MIGWNFLSINKMLVYILLSKRSTVVAEWMWLALVLIGLPSYIKRCGTSLRMYLAYSSIRKELSIALKCIRREIILLLDLVRKINNIDYKKSHLNVCEQILNVSKREKSSLFIMTSSLYESIHIAIDIASNNYSKKVYLFYPKSLKSSKKVKKYLCDHSIEMISEMDNISISNNSLIVGDFTQCVLKSPNTVISAFGKGLYINNSMFKIIKSENIRCVCIKYSSSKASLTPTYMFSNNRNDIDCQVDRFVRVYLREIEKRPDCFFFWPDLFCHRVKVGCA